ncbi:ubiquitin carboxyl-terminal hydrolase 18-like isoform X2 [Magnolia sinica]|uniref:ubiquitin carboxyl-terminal hydrolase 18-like isoform X2 n=1 Tax=Magnolia sinica TaxID=86752 RepID=UPI002659AD8C|nr:ubiquitin carboxyl-terminal hydrolase 18-like isoform X2 [Magnolia sinica]
MHVSDLSFDLSPLLQFVLTTLVLGLGLLHVIKATASRYLVVDARFEGGDGPVDTTVDCRAVAPGGAQMLGGGDAVKCFVCGGSATKICSGCKAVRYCSTTCQSKHWKEDHKLKCKDLKFSNSIDSKSSLNGAYVRRRALGQVDDFNAAFPLIPARGTCKVLQQSKKVLFPYDEFVKLFNGENQGFPPCGLLNCGNSCFANVVLQCLACTRPLVAYLLEKGHSRKCNRNDWCFLCELELHIHRVSQSLHPFSPINILSRLPNIGGNLGYGKQEDAHEFMRFAIDTMQSVFLDEFGGENALDHSTQQTTLIQHIFGGHLQSQVICTECDNISYCYENMMDLTVEIQGDAASLENCLDQFTKKEWLDGENMYKCDRCNDYVKAWKRLTVHQAPNILTIALKRFQSGRFGKLNKRVTFPETLDLGPYMSESGDGTDLYRLYAVVVHVDMLNASFFGHYICYTQDFCGNWYRIDDCKVMKVELEEVLAQGAYMLLYSRINARQPCVKPHAPAAKEEQPPVEAAREACLGLRDSVGRFDNVQSGSSVTMPGCPSSDIRLQPGEELADRDLVHPINVDSDPVREDQENVRSVCSQSSTSSLTGPDDAAPSCNSHEAAQLPSIELKHEEPVELISHSGQSAIGSNAVEAQEPAASSAKDCHRKEENDSSGWSIELGSPESSRGCSSPMNMPETSGVSSADLNNLVESAEDANLATSLSRSNPRLEPSLITGNPSVLGTGVTRSGKAFRATENASEVKSSMLLGDKTTSNCKPKPLFRPGFLGKPVGKKSVSKNEKAQNKTAEAGSSQMVSGNYNNAFAEPACARQNGSEVNGHDDASLQKLGGSCKGLVDSKKFVISPGSIDKLSGKMPLDESGESNGETVVVGPTYNTDCNGTSRPDLTDQNSGEVHIHVLNNDKRSEFCTGKIEASCNRAVDTSILNQNGSSICRKDKRPVIICENGDSVILDTGLQNKLLGAEVAQKELDGVGRDPPLKTVCNGFADSVYATDGSKICSRDIGPGASRENHKDMHLNCKRPRQEHD